MFLGSLSRHNKDLEQWTLEPSPHHSSRVLDKPCYSSQANQCYSSILFRRQQENPSSKREGMATQRLEGKRVEECMGEGEREGRRERKSAGMLERKRESALAPPFICFCLHLGLPCANWAQPGVLFVLPEDFTLVPGPSFSISCLLATAILDSFPLFYLPNSMKRKEWVKLKSCCGIPQDEDHKPTPQSIRYPWCQNSFGAVKDGVEQTLDWNWFKGEGEGQAQQKMQTHVLEPVLQKGSKTKNKQKNWGSG